MRRNSDRLNVKRADVVRFRFVGEGYYVTAIYCKHIIEFCQHYVRHGEEIHTIYANKKGISINLQDEWNDFLLNIISSIHRHYQKFPTRSHDVDVSTTTKAVIWDIRLAWCVIDLEDNDECTY